MKVNGFRCVDLMAASSSVFCVQHSRWIRCWAGAVQQSSEWHLSKSLFENFNLVSPTSRKILVNENIYKTKNQAAHFFSKLLKSRSAPFNLFEMVISFLFNKFSTNSKIGLTNAKGKINPWIEPISIKASFSTPHICTMFCPKMMLPLLLQLLPHGGTISRSLSCLSAFTTTLCQGWKKPLNFALLLLPTSGIKPVPPE